ncbi:MAG TPA: hypothetical protein VK166_13740 [Chitinophagaceae bacterium]|nr:hypothetical protein [Chitinophagaceae bacterium]
MGNLRLRKIATSIVVIIFILTAMIQCTKDGVNAPLIERAVVDPDSTVFSSFYDTVWIERRDVTPDVNDVIGSSGVLSIIKSNCGSSACHSGSFKPSLSTYADIRALVVPGNPEGSKLYQLITTSEVAKAMPPVNYGVDLSVTEKTKIYNWIKHGANERPVLEDFRPAAVSLITNGCGSANCHNQATVGGAWARRKLIDVAPGDTVSYNYINPATGAVTIYAQLKEPKLSQVWNAYKDSARKFATDTVANAGFRPYKTFGTPITASSIRGALNNYDDLIFDIHYPKSLRTSGTPLYTSPSGVKYYNRGNVLNATSALISRIDSTILLANPSTKLFATSHQGDMAYGDGGLSRSEIALIKAWYFADPNISEVWKYGTDGSGIFKYRKTGTIIKKN